jgi:uncharacterized protein
MPAYDCAKCPGYCCSYPQIAIKRADVARLARHFKLTFEAAERKFTRAAYGRKWVLRRQRDPHFAKICRFFDRHKRNCTVYAARPGVCRSFPDTPRCGYYDFLSWERAHHNDPDYVARTDSGSWP